jgi:hypothetical protein
MPNGIQPKSVQKAVPPPPVKFPAGAAAQRTRAPIHVPPPPVKFAPPPALQAKAAPRAAPPEKPCCRKCAADAQHNPHPSVPQLIQPKAAALQPSIASHRVTTSSLPMLTRGKRKRAETELNRKGHSLDNVVNYPRIRKKVKRDGCANYPGTFAATINGVATNVPYDWTNGYACFEQYMMGAGVQIAYTGGRNGDYAAANAAAGYGATPGGYTWHHFEDYDPFSNTGTMQLVLTAAHSAVFHFGGAWQWQLAHANTPYLP